MRVTVTVIDPRWGIREDILLDADDSTPTREVVAELLGVLARPNVPEDGHAEVVSLAGHRLAGAALAGMPLAGDSRGGGGDRSGPAATAPTLYVNGDPIDPDVAIAESGLRDGSVVSLGDATASIVGEPQGSLEVRIVGGPGAGAVHRLTPGSASVGSDPSCAIVIPDPSLPPVAAVVTVRHDGTVTVAVPASRTAGTTTGAVTLDRQPLTPSGADAGTGGEVDWPADAQLGVGQALLERHTVRPPDAHVVPSAEPGWLDYNRPPRLLPPERQTVFKLPPPPGEHQRNLIPWLAIVMPAVLGVVMVAVLHNWMYLTMAFASPLMMLGNVVQGRRQGKSSYRQQLARYKETRAKVEADADQALVDERVARRREAPDPATVLLIATGPRMRLWERRRDDPDYLSVRLGVGDIESDVTLEDPEQLEHRRRVAQTAYDVPVTVSLRERGVLGIAGGGDLPRDLGRWAVAQLAVLQSPRDTWLYVLTDTAHVRAWDWVRWLPHARPQSGQDTLVTLGHDTETCARRVAELSAQLTARRAALAANGNRALGGPDIVVVLDGARRLRSLPGVVALLKEGPALGIRVIALDAQEQLLPEEASAVVLQTPSGLVVRQQREDLVSEVTPDLVSEPWLQRVAHALAPLRDISGSEEDSVLPSACRLLDVIGLEPPSADSVAARWALSGRSTEAVVGVSLDGPFAIDLVRDGPHGLIAGTTGAGKSELLQTIVASLAVANRPDGMTFVLVDYKGGAAFKDCVDLPHTVGMVTDLDTHLVERALTSLGAELTRREHQLAEVGAKDIEDYVDLSHSRGGLEPMPRLLIVIDEFASLARELPDFVTGLVNIAQRGRSLGIHLILATQRPSGVVSPEIRANTNLRVALRVTDAGESSDVLEAPDAGRISKRTPGRAYVRLGASSLVPFQSGRVGGRRPGVVSATVRPAWLTAVTDAMMGQPAPMPPRTASAATDAEVTDLTVLVDAVREATERLGLPAQHSPWLPALTSDLVLADLLAGRVLFPPATALVPPAPYAMEDLPAEQARRAATVDLHTFSHLAIVGGPRSGRSQAVRTMAGSLAQVASPADIHLYGLDCGNGALLPLTDLPHCGAVVQRTQTDRVVRLLDRLSAEVARRQEVLAAGGFADLDELRVSVSEAERLPHLVLFLDRWEGFLGSFADHDNGALVERVQTMLREGASVGVHLVITGDRSLVAARMGSLVEDKIALRMPDRNDYGLLGLNPRKLPEDVPEGRGFREGSATELQVALLGPDPSGHAQAADLRAIGLAAREAYAEVPRAALPFRLDVLPSRLGFEDAWELRAEAAAHPLWALVGVGGDELTAYGLDLARTPAAVVAGPPRSGRSTLLVGMTESLLRGGAEVVIAAPRPSPLRELAGRAGVRAVLTGGDISEEEIAPLMTEGDGPVVLVIDDGELYRDVEAQAWFKAFQRTMGDRGRAIILGGSAADVASGFSGWQVDLKGRQGVLLSPGSLSDGDLVGVRLSRSTLVSAPSPGRILANLGDGELVALTAPLAPEAHPSTDG